VPPDQRFYAGGPNSVRGFARNELARACTCPTVWKSTDGHHLQQDPGVTHRWNTVFTANLELRVPSPIFPERVRLGLFVT